MQLIREPPLQGHRQSDFADMRRILSSKDPVVLFLQTRDEDGNGEIHVVLYPSGMSSLFGSADTSELGRSMEQFMKAELLEAGSTAALHDHAFDERHKALYREYQRQFETDTKDAGCLLNPRVKRDHKSQYRMQCAVSKKDVDSMIGAGIQIGAAIPMDDFMVLQADATKRETLLSEIDDHMPVPEAGGMPA